MAIKYKYVPYRNPLSTEAEEQRVRPQVVVSGRSDRNDLIERIVQNNYYARPDAAKAVEAVFASIEEILSSGNTVHINGFGSFMVSAQFVKENIDNLDPDKKAKSDVRRAENIEVKRVVFRASREMKLRIGGGNFVRDKK